MCCRTRLIHPQCDRYLPSCSNCVGNRAACSYPEPYKRGFPEGYMSGLEQRLIQTELALFEVLTTHTAPGAPSIARKSAELFKEHAASVSKGRRMQEWQELPLDTQAERLAWWHKAAAELDLGSEHGVPMLVDCQKPQSEPQGRGPGRDQRLYERSASGSPIILSPEESWGHGSFSGDGTGASNAPRDITALDPANAQPHMSPLRSEEDASLASTLAKSYTRRFF